MQKFFSAAFMLERRDVLSSQCLIASDWHLTWSIFTLKSLEQQIFLAREAISVIGKCIIRALTQIFINVVEVVFIESNHFKIAFYFFRLAKNHSWDLFHLGAIDTTSSYQQESGMIRVPLLMCFLL